MTNNDHSLIARVDVYINGRWRIEVIRPLAYTEAFESMVQESYGNRDVATCRRAWELCLQKVNA